VLLTTLTTVLGLAPLLYEGSADAQFLKPTVITLVYGLGFGMVIVLLVVPAILAMQQDFAKQVRALRRGATFGRRKGPGGAAGRAGGPIAALFAATVGAHLVTGQMPDRWQGSGMADCPATAAFIAASALVCAVAWIGASFAGLRRTA
jgi:predicted RND superfamily exporter protein